MKGIYTLEELEKLLVEKPGLLLYFSSKSCSVCKVLKPKVNEFLAEDYPEMEIRYVDIEKSPLLAGQYRVFTIPTILIFFDAKEQSRFSRNISLRQLDEVLSKPYSIIFGE